MSVVLLVDFKIKEDKVVEFEEVVGSLSREVLANEPGAKMYQLCKSSSDPLAYHLVEVYDDAEALAAHGQSAHYKSHAPRLGPCLDGAPVINRCETVG